jgi:hypothetical protein
MSEHHMPRNYQNWFEYVIGCFLEGYLYSTKYLSILKHVRGQHVGNFEPGRDSNSMWLSAASFK